MSEQFSREKRYACLECPAYYKCERGNISATAGGWTKKVIDGKEMTCCQPQTAAGTFRAMKQYGLYCTATPGGKLIAYVHNYTGKVPLWCPRLEAQKHD